MKPLTVAPDAEHVVIDFLTAALAARLADTYGNVYTDIYGSAANVTVGVNIPLTWTTATKPHVQVMLIGTPEVQYPILARASVGVTCWAASTTTAKALASLCLGLMCSHAGGAGVTSIQALTGVQPARDPDSGAQMASISVQVNLRMSVLA